MFSEEILEVYRKCNIHSFPINCTYVLNCYGYKLLSYGKLLSKNKEASNLAKAFSDDCFTDRKNRLILYNDRVNSGRMRFSQMHELGHIVLGHTDSTQVTEEEADYFASNILAPRPIIHREKLKTSDEIHNYFGISYSAANYVIRDFKNWKPGLISDNKLLRHFSITKNFDDSAIIEINKLASLFEELNPNCIFLEAKYFI